MMTVNMYTGEPVDNTGSSFISENEAINNASFGKALYENQQYNNGYYNQYPQQQQPMMYNNGFGNYNQYYQQQPMMYNPGNCNYNIGQGQNYYQPIGLGSDNQILYKPTFLNNSNFVTGIPNSPPQQLSSQYNNNGYYIPPVLLTGEYLFPTDIEDQVMKLQMEFIHELDEAEFAYSNENNYNAGYNNYYTMPYYNNSRFTEIDRKYQNKLNKILEDAKQARIDFETRLNKLCHRACNDGITDEMVEEDMKGRYIKPSTSFINEVDCDNKEEKAYIEECIARNKGVENSIPAEDSAIFYQQQFSMIREEYLSVLPECKNLKDFLDNAWALNLRMVQEEERSRRRNLLGLYGCNNQNNPSNDFRNLLRMQIANRAKKKALKKQQEQFEKQQKQFNNILNEATAINNQIQFNENTNNDFIKFQKEHFKELCPTLANSGSTISDDGVLTIRCNFGSEKSQNIIDAVENENEDLYNEERKRFMDLITSAMSYKSSG